MGVGGRGGAPARSHGTRADTGRAERPIARCRCRCGGPVPDSSVPPQETFGGRSARCGVHLAVPYVACHDFTAHRSVVAATTGRCTGLQTGTPVHTALGREGAPPPGPPQVSAPLLLPPCTRHAPRRSSLAPFGGRGRAALRAPPRGQWPGGDAGLRPLTWRREATAASAHRSPQAGVRGRVVGAPSSGGPPAEASHWEVGGRRGERGGLEATFMGQRGPPQKPPLSPQPSALQPIGQAVAGAEGGPCGSAENPGTPGGLAAMQEAGARDVLEEGAGGAGPKRLCTKKWPDQIFPTVNSIAFGKAPRRETGEAPWATWAWRPQHGSHWVLKYPYCHQMITQTHPQGRRKSFGQKRKISSATTELFPAHARHQMEARRPRRGSEATGPRPCAAEGPPGHEVWQIYGGSLAPLRRRGDTPQHSPPPPRFTRLSWRHIGTTPQASTARRGSQGMCGGMWTGARHGGGLASGSNPYLHPDPPSTPHCLSAAVPHSLGMGGICGTVVMGIGMGVGRDALEAGRGTPPPLPLRVPSLCPATVTVTPSASLNGICNRR